jgi:putative mRNA 3-end processing factor
MLIEFTDSGFYCPEGDFHIDPVKPVERAVITHAHSDHACRGHGLYLCHTDTLPLLRLRLGEISAQALAYGEPVVRNGVRISLHPAGHVIGSAQVRVERDGEVWVASGDYKPDDDGVSGAFEPVRCHHFITESTFGLPIYQWKRQEDVYEEILQWTEDNRRSGRNTVLLAYSLGKSQRLIHALGERIGPMYVHESIWKTQEVLLAMGRKFPAVNRLSANGQAPPGSVIISPVIPSFREGSAPCVSANCSGWMQVRSGKRWGGNGPGFALSDHADWPGLLDSIRATEATHIHVTHGFQSVLSRYLGEQGWHAEEVTTGRGNPEDKPSSNLNQGEDDED